MYLNVISLIRFWVLAEVHVHVLMYLQRNLPNLLPFYSYSWKQETLFSRLGLHIAFYVYGYMRHKSILIVNQLFTVNVGTFTVQTNRSETTDQRHGLVNTLIFLLSLQISWIAELQLASSWRWKLEVSSCVHPGSPFIITTPTQWNYVYD